MQGSETQETPMRGFQPQTKRKVHASGYADGGMVQSIKRAFGMDEERNARIAAYRARAAQEKAAAAAQPATPASAPSDRAISDYSGMGATQRREKALGLKDGGMVRGPGTGISDDVPDRVPEGTYIMPADSTAQLGPDKLASMGARGFKAGGKKAAGGKSVPVNLSNGEFKLPPEQVHAVGVQALEQMKNATHTPAAQQAGEPEMFFANGGAVFGSRGLEGLKAMIPKVAAMGFPQQAAPVAPAAPAQGSRNVADLKAMIPQMEAMGFKQNPQYLADGGPVRRPGVNMDEWAQQQEQQRAAATREQEAMAAAAAQAPAAAPASAVSQIPTGGYPQAPAPTGQADSDLTRNVNNSLNALGGIGAVATVPLRAAQGVARGFPALAGPARAAAAPAADFVAGMGSNATTFANTIPRLGNVPTPTLPAVNAALQQGAQANAMAGAARAAGGASAGATGLANTQPADAAPITTPATPSADLPEWSRGQMGYGEQMRNVGAALANAPINAFKHLVGAPGYGFNQAKAAAPAAPAPAAPSAAGAGRGAVNPPMADPSAPTPAPANAPAAAPEVMPGVYRHGRGQYSDNAAGMGVPAGFTGQPSAENMARMDAIANRSQQASMGRALSQPAGFQPQGVTAPTVRHSGNDWAARNALRNAEVSASSIMNTSRWGGRGAENNPSALAYQAMLKNDLALQGAQPGVDVAAMRENAGITREGMQQDGATTRTGMTEQGANAREAGRNALTTEELGLKREAQGFQTRAAQQQEQLRNVLLDPKSTPEQRAVAQRNLAALSGKTAADRMQAVALPDTTNEMGQVVRGGQALVRVLEDGTVQQVPIGAQQGAALPPGMKRQIGTSNGRPVYEDMNGKQVIAKG